MLAKRIIPCLDVKDERTVKGTNFVNLRDAGDAVELGELYKVKPMQDLPQYFSFSRNRNSTFEKLSERAKYSSENLRFG